MNKLRVFWIVATMVLASLMVGTVAKADSTSEFPGCWSGNVGVGPNFHWVTGSGGVSHAGQYAYSPLFTVPSSPDGCEDINVSCGVSQCGDYRVRFYPSSGGNFANAWTGPPCGQSWCYVAVATNVLNGTNYRIEWRLTAGGAYGDHRFDMWV